MVLLVERLTKLYSKLENHHHHHQQPEALHASLKAFRSKVSSCITQLILNLKPELELEWVRQCFQILPMIKQAFAKLVVEIDYHVSKWQAKSMEEYLNYSLELLDLFNSISSSISHLDQAKVSLFHALSILETSSSMAIEKLKATEFKSMKKEIKKKENKEEKEKERSCSEKELVVLQALMELRCVGFWVCSIVLAGLCGDNKVFMEMRKSAVELSNPALINLDSRVCEIVKEGFVLKEVKELKQSSASLAATRAGGRNSSNVAEELHRKLEEFEKKLNDIGKEVDHLFSEVFAGRNEVLNGIRFRK